MRCLPLLSALLAGLTLTVFAGCDAQRRAHIGDPPDTAYYADLGPDTIDVSDYPSEQKEHYKAFVRVCSQCHTLARAVNAPTGSRLYWHFHLARMSLHSRFSHKGPFSREDVNAILDFLEYDSKVRKIQNRERFDRQTEELKRRYDPILERRLWRLYQDG